MTTAITSFGRNDLRGLRREPLLAGIVFAPLVWIAMVRFGTPPAERLVNDRYGLDLAPHYPLILTGFLLLTSALIVGGLASFLVLDERDAGTFAVLRVTPISLGSYLGYRAATVVVVTTGYVVGTMSASGLLPADQVLPLVPVGMLCGLSGIITGLLILALARNKVQGIAVLRGLGILFAGLPLIPYFLGPEWQYPFWLLPQFWPSKTYWLIAEHATWWPYLLGGMLYHLPLIWLLYRRFTRSID
ncbi:ABC transporter permease [Amycolatopsis anabasis]|uniref:ABC transporter permease n=1 Tax=Amycolatopsis anabasis TaxID=1840409 RepID=UPI00131BE6D7|nr:ABC transporter permease [Amycolatopsis anabasis]